MDEYIGREAVLQQLSCNHEIRFFRVADADGTWVSARDVVRAINKVPAANVVERKRGEWVVTECDMGEPGGYPAFIEFHCPFCNEPYSLESGEYNWSYGDAIPLKFCHECGADMREVDP